MQKGKIKWFDETKGYGFIVPGDGSADVFFHKNSIKSDTAALNKDTAPNTNVLYDVETLKKGKKPEAVNITLV